MFPLSIFPIFHILQRMVFGMVDEWIFGFVSGSTFSFFPFCFSYSMVDSWHNALPFQFTVSVFKYACFIETVDWILVWYGLNFCEQFLFKKSQFIKLWQFNNQSPSPCMIIMTWRLIQSYIEFMDHIFIHLPIKWHRIVSISAVEINEINSKKHVRISKISKINHQQYD